jgi:hypothetical protein
LTAAFGAFGLTGAFGTAALAGALAAGFNGAGAALAIAALFGGIEDFLSAYFEAGFGAKLNFLSN